MRTRFDFGISKLRLTTATTQAVHGELEREGERYAFTISEVDACPPAPRLECLARHAARSIQWPQSELDYKVSFGAWEVQPPDDTHPASWITFAAKHEPRVLPGVAMAYAQFPATQQVLLYLFRLAPPILRIYPPGPGHY